MYSPRPSYSFYPNIFYICCLDKTGLKAVKIYLSEFGRGRLAEEDRLGPEELRKAYPSNNLSAEGDDSSEESDLDIENDNYEENEIAAREKVRKYQVNRLRYYYAVAEFGSVEAADIVYKNCDGTEYELSGTR